MSYPNFTTLTSKIHKNTPKSVNHKRTYAALRVFFYVNLVCSPP